GIRIEDAEHLNRLLQEQEPRGLTGFLEPVSLVEADHPFTLRVCLPDPGQRCQWRLELEDGSCRTGTVKAAELRAESVQGHAGVRLLATAPAPAGYHPLDPGAPRC